MFLCYKSYLLYVYASVEVCATSDLADDMIYVSYMFKSSLNGNPVEEEEKIKGDVNVDVYQYTLSRRVAQTPRQVDSSAKLFFDMRYDKKDVE